MHRRKMPVAILSGFVLVIRVLQNGLGFALRFGPLQTGWRAVSGIRTHYHECFDFAGVQ